MSLVYRESVQAAKFRIGINHHLVECQQVLSRVIDAEVLNAERLQRLLRNRIAELEVLQTNITTVLQPEIGFLKIK